MDLSDFTFGERTPETDARLGEVMLYVAATSKHPERLDAVVLSKILWRAEMRCFGELGEPLTGAEYASLPHGPGPTHCELVRQKLVACGAAAERPISTGIGVTRRVLLPLRECDRSCFSAEQLSRVDRAIAEFDAMTTTQATATTHGIAWQLGKVLGRLPYESHFVSERPIDDEARRIAKQVAARIAC